MDKSIRSYRLSPRATLAVTSPRFYDIKYIQAYINLWAVKPNEEVLDIPIGPPLPREFQIFQFRMTSESPETEYSLHVKPYNQCEAVSWIFKCHLNANDEMMQETWLVKPNNRSVMPYLYFSFKELAGVNPGSIRLEMRMTN